MRKSVLLLALVIALQFQAKAQAPQHAPDGGTMERVVGPYIPTIAGAPFSAYVVTEWTRLLPDGTTGTTKNRRLVARDSSGRVFEEHRIFTVDGDTRPTRVFWTNYADPQRHEYYACAPGVHICEVAPLPSGAPQNTSVGVSSQVPHPSSQNAGAAPQSRPGMPEVKTEALGQQQIGNVDAVGSREITTFPQGAFGNQMAEPVIKEFWYSDRLQVNVLTKRFDPRVSASQIFTFTNISLSEPNPKLFVVPESQMIQVPTPNAAAMSASVMSPGTQQPRPQPINQAAR